jgi:putative transposase
MSKFERKSNRLKVPEIYNGGHWYFITIVAGQRACIFDIAESIDFDPDKNTLSHTIGICLIDLEKIFDGIFIHDWVIMPNHLHVIISMTQNSKSRISNKNVSLGDVIKSYKTQSQKQTIELFLAFPFLTSNLPFGFNFNKIWHKSFHDRIIRNEVEFYNIQKYILQNPIEWSIDILNPTANIDK